MDGVEVVVYLQKECEYVEKLWLDLILFDLNLFKWGGCQVLEKIKKDLDLLCILVVVFIIFNVVVDVLVSYDLYVNCFINKLVDFDNFFQIIMYIQKFWLEIVILLGIVSQLVIQFVNCLFICLFFKLNG